MSTFQIIGGSPTDQCFTLEAVTPNITWNVTRLRRDALSNLFGPPVSIPTESVPPPNWQNGNLLRDRVDWIKAHPEILNEPSIAIAEAPGSARPVLCICDGNHRVTARQELGLPQVSFYLVPHEMEKSYRITILLDGKEFV